MSMFAAPAALRNGVQQDVWVVEERGYGAAVVKASGEEQTDWILAQYWEYLDL